MKSDLIKQFKAARRAGTPLMAITTPDPTATMHRLLKAYNGSRPAAVHWDPAGGYTPLGEQKDAEALMTAFAIAPAAANSPFADMNAPGDPLEVAAACTNIVSAMDAALRLPEDTIIFTQALQDFLAGEGQGGAQGAAPRQSVRNLRNPFKMSGRTLVLLAPGITLPETLKDDMLVLDEPLPTRDELRGIVTGIFEDNEMPLPDEKSMDKAVDALAGLAAFSAEQATAMCLTKEGLDLVGLNERKRQMIGQTPGLEVRRESTTFTDLRGLSRVKERLGRLAEMDAFDCVLWVDELEKMMAGSFQGAGDSGVGKDALGQVLSWMQDRMNREALIAMLFLGGPGTGKSAIAQAVGNTAGRPLIKMDFGAMKSKWVGESEQFVRTALRVVDAISQRRVLLIGTCNSATNIDSALLSRFGQRWYFDLPDEEEAGGIWDLYRGKFKIPAKDKTPQTPGWTGREIRLCCEWAALYGESLAESALNIVPIAVSAEKEIQTLRNEAHDKMLAASYVGFYNKAKAVPLGEAAAKPLQAMQSAFAKGGRKMKLE